MVSAVHRCSAAARAWFIPASKGLHMVSAVHPGGRTARLANAGLQRGCTWLVQFIYSYLVSC